jgi:hypothetical protein
MNRRTDARRLRLRACATLAALLALPAAYPRARQATPDEALEKAVGELRRIEPAKLSGDEQEAKAKTIDEAWKVIAAAGARGRERVKLELRRVDEAKERDDFFKLNASAILWNTGGFEEAEVIAAIWTATPLTASYNYAFYTAMDAARTQDGRALPMLRAFLRDREGRTFFSAHAMRVEWPLTHEFAWGAYGPKGLPALRQILETSDHAVELMSAARLSAKAQYWPAYARLRELATKADVPAEVRATAACALGFYGHPQDFDLLVAGLRSPDPGTAFKHAFALYEYEDLRAVPHLVPLLASPDQAVRYEAISALRHLLTPAGLEALRRHGKTAKDSVEGERVKRLLRLAFEKMRTTEQQYDRMTPQQKEAAASGYRREFEEDAVMPKGERALTRPQFLAAAARWKKNGRLDGPDEPRHILPAATTADIDLLLGVRSQLYLRLSDECLYEVGRIEKAVKHLGRRRYRRVTGITERAELLK